MKIVMLYVFKQYNHTILVLDENDPENLHALDKSVVYDLSKCRFSNEIAVTDLDLKRYRQRITKATVRRLLSTYGRSCTYCYKDLTETNYHIDHIKPICAGGTNEFTNLAVTCAECNLMKSGKLFTDLAQIRAYLTYRKARR
jgi:5-methylcytosine-specific restriction endonuclease McrA